MNHKETPEHRMLRIAANLAGYGMFVLGVFLIAQAIREYPINAARASGWGVLAFVNTAALLITMAVAEKLNKESKEKNRK